MPRQPIDDEADELPRIGPAGEAIGLSPRMVRYLEEQGVIAAERGPGPRGHRHYPPPELHLGRAASLAMDAVRGKTRKARSDDTGFGAKRFQF